MKNEERAVNNCKMTNFIGGDFLLKFCTFNYFVNIMRISKWIKGKCIIVGNRRGVYRKGLIRIGVDCIDWTCGYCSGQVSKEKYDYVIGRIFEGVE